MRNKVLILSVILYFFIIPYNLYSNDFTNLKNKINLKQGDILVLALFHFDYCINCYINTFETIENLKKIINRKNDTKFVFVAYVDCDRDAELKIFKKKYHWSGFTLRQNKKLCKLLNISGGKDIVLLNSKGKILMELSFNEKNLYKKLVNLFKEGKK